jgi:putative ABC transport system permease protein
MAWGVFRVARRALLPGLTRDENAGMEELIAMRLRAARSRFLGETWVWVREFVDLTATSFREFIRRPRGSRTERNAGGWLTDLRIAARSLARRPGFSLGVASTLALGIGATTTVYSVVDGVMLRPLPYDDASRLVAIGALPSNAPWIDPETGLQQLTMISMPNYLDFQERTRSFDGIAALEPNRSVVPNEVGPPDLLGYANVSPGTLEMFGAEPALGRLFRADEYSPAGGDVVVLSHGAWQRRFGGDPDVVGRQLTIVGDITVVGVLPSDFRPPEALFPGGAFPDLWFPMQDDPTSAPGWYDRRRGRLHLIGRLAEDVSVAEARTEAATIASELAALYPEANGVSGAQVGIGVNSLLRQTVGGSERGLALFLGAAALLLLLAIMNAATLLLAHSLDRAREFGVRMALGAGRARMVRLLLGESALLSLVGGALGVGLAFVGVAAFVRFAPASIPRLDSVSVDSRVLLAAAVLSLGAGLVAGLLPALRLTRRGPWERLLNASRTYADSQTRVRAALVGAQVAIAMTLVSGAALLSTSFARLRSADPGFDPNGLMAITVDIKMAAGWDFQRQWVAWDNLLDELRAVPGIESIGLASDVPFSVPRWTPHLRLPDDPAGTERDGIAGYAIMPDYLETMRTSVLAGRNIRSEDGPLAERVALVNESFARRLLGGIDPVGMTIGWVAGSEWSPGDEWIPPREWLDGEPTPIRIVGVVEDVVQASLEEGPRPAIYVPYTQYRGGPTAVIRTRREVDDILPELRVAAARFNDNVPLIDFATVHGRMVASYGLPRFQTLLVGTFAAVATLLATAGLFASLSHAIGRRQREIGVRIALGADRPGIFGSVLRTGLSPVVGGVVVGLLATLASTRALAGFLYGVAPNDPSTLMTAATVFLTVSALACVVPARRATSVDPVRVLNSD